MIDQEVAIVSFLFFAVSHVGLLFIFDSWMKGLELE